MADGSEAPKQPEPEEAEGPKGPEPVVISMAAHTYTREQVLELIAKVRKADADGLPVEFR